MIESVNDLTCNSTRNRSFWRCSSQPISCLVLSISDRHTHTQTDQLLYRTTNMVCNYSVNKLHKSTSTRCACNCLPLSLYINYVCRPISAGMILQATNWNLDVGDNTKNQMMMDHIFGKWFGIFISSITKSEQLSVLVMHSGRASQRSWSRRTIPNKHGRRQDCGCWLQQNDVTLPAACLRPCSLGKMLGNRQLQTLLLFWLDVRSLENI